MPLFPFLLFPVFRVQRGHLPWVVPVQLIIPAHHVLLSSGCGDGVGEVVVHPLFQVQVEIALVFVVRLAELVQRRSSSRYELISELSEFSIHKCHLNIFFFFN